MASLKDIYKKSSLVMHPAAMKDGKLYSQVPHSGDGDFTFSRADGVQTRVNKHGLIETVADNTPRLSYDLIDGEPVDCPHLLLEPSRTNRFLYSEDFSNASWLKYNSVSVIINDSISPDGNNTATTLSNATGTSRNSNVLQFNASGLSSSTAYTFSVYVKSTNTTNVQLGLFDGSTGVNNNQDFTVTSIWQRIEFTATTGSSTTSLNAYIGDTSGDISIWGAQLEAGTYATSYIPTSGSTETREAEDSITALDVTNPITSISEGTLFGELQLFDTDTADNKNWISIDNGTGYSDDRVMVYLIAGSSAMYGQVKSNSGANVSTFQGREISDNENVKFALAFKNDYIKFYINGIEEGSSSSYTLNASAFTNVRIGYSGQNEMKLKQLVAFNEALSDSELEKVTSWTSFGEMAESQLYIIE